MLDKCQLCPYECKVNRTIGEIGRCKATEKIKLASFMLHFNEEPCISGKSGSGAVFFSNCNLKCVFCQNYEISSFDFGEEIDEKRLSDIFLELQERKANNINLVTPTPYVYKIIEAIKKAKENGLTIPIIYNSSGYEKIETLKMLDGLVDVYLPDFKYADNELSKRLSGTDNYFEICKDAILEMQRQVGSPKLDKEGIIKKGLIIRHLILPNHIENTKKVLKWISENVEKEVYVSVMTQYFPCFKAKDIKDINRKINYDEYLEVENYIEKLNFENGYMQDFCPEDDEEKYVPDFKKSNDNF